MQTKALQAPVAFFVFRRPDTTRRVFEAIAKARPARLLLIADGPRDGRAGEAEACEQVRKIITNVDWPCEVIANFSDRNLGCGERVISGLDWVFSLVDEAIILEDDCLPDLSFFPFCQELLERYRGDCRIASITGTNLGERHLKTEYSYYFSQLGGIWGWATWKSQWLRYDRTLEDWPRLKQDRTLYEIFDDARAVSYWTRVFDAMHEKRAPDTWDYQMFFTRMKHNALSVIPSLNLVTNIGFGGEATHTAAASASLMRPAKTMGFPLKHPSSFVPLRSVDRRMQNLNSPPMIERLIRKVRYLKQAFNGEIHS
jgi:hypothetical protein